MKHVRPDDMEILPPRVPVAWRPPFSVAAWYDERPAGQTLFEIAKTVPGLPPVFMERGVICINGEAVPRSMWHRVRPKPDAPGRPIAVTLHMPLQGGGNGNVAKQIGAIVAAIALVVVTAGIAGGVLGPGGALSISGTLFGAGSTSAALLAGAVGLVGALAVSALTAPPTTGGPGAAAGDDTNTDQKEASSASGNTLEPGGAIPRVLGTRKTFPPFACQPLVELVDEDEYVEAAYVLNGPHLIENVSIDGVFIADAEDVEYETREGWDDDAALTLVTRQGHTIFPQSQLSVHKVNSDAQNNLLHPLTPTDDLPVWHSAITRNGPDEFWMQFLLPNGISVNGSTSTDVVVPIRIRIRQRGDVSWINLPEIHLSDSTLQQRRRAVLFKFETAPADIGTVVPVTAGGFTYANINVPGQVTAPATSGWAADSYFVGSSGNDYLNASVAGSSKVANTALYYNRVEFYLDPATFPAAIYEVQVMRGSAFLASSFTQSTYSYSGSVKDFFTYSSTTTPVIPMSRANLADVIQLVRASSVWNEHPIAGTGFALIAIKARNRPIQRVAAQASGYVQDWVDSPAGWTNWTTTSNPAAHYRDVLVGAQNIDPLPEDLVDDTTLVEWRTLCATNDWTCDTIISDERTADVLAKLASSAYARSYQSDVYTVAIDSDRSADSPEQIFSRVNSTNVRMQKAFARIPQAFVVGYRDEANDDDRAQVIVYQSDPSIATSGLFESINYDGLVTAAKVEARAQFDLDQANMRSTFYYLDTDAEALVVRKGSLVGLQHDVLTDRSGVARIVSKITTSPANITGFVLDSEIPIRNEADMHTLTDMHAVTDMHIVGLVTGIAIRRTDGTVSTHQLSNATGSTATVTLTTMISDTNAIEGLSQNGYQHGCMVVSGDLGSEYVRLLVAAISPSSGFKATLTLVDEAPDLVRYAP